MNRAPTCLGRKSVAMTRIRSTSSPGTTLTWSTDVGGPATLARGQVVEFITAAPFVVASQDEDHPFVLFEHMSSTVFPETRYIVRKAGQDNFKGPGVLLKAGESSYRPTLCGFPNPSPPPPGPFICRWGDFEAASADLAGHIWFAGEYANTVTVANHGRNWGTWIGAINAS